MTADTNFLSTSIEKATLIKIFSFLALIFFGIFSVYYFFQGDLTLTVVNSGTFLWVFINYFLNKFKKNENFALKGLAPIGLSALIPWQLTGGVSGTGIFWYYVFIVWLFFLLGKQKGTIAVCLAFSLSLGIFFLQSLGYAPNPYPLTSMITFYFGFIIQAILVYTFQLAKERSETALKKQSTILAEINTTIENKVQERTKELHNEQIKLQASINSLSVGFIMVDTNFDIITINQAAKNNFFVTNNYILESKFTIAHIEEALQGSINIRVSINECITNKQPVTLKEVAFKNRYLRIFLTPIIALGVIGAVILVEDITEAKILERSKDEFFSIASHELRTPLTAIRGNAQMILDYYKEQIKNPTLTEMVHDIHDSGVRLIAVVNDFLDVSRLEQGKIVFKKTNFDIMKTIQQIIREYDIARVKPQVSFEFEQPAQPIPLVNSDQNHVKQILLNLLNNAMKYTEVGGIKITPRVENNVIKISVVDTGKGIPPESQQLLFHKFQQASNNILTRDNTQSTGLGLYISKLLAEGMGGKLYLEKSEVGKGSTFTLELSVT